MAKCPNCNKEIKGRYIGSRDNPSRIKCPKCKKKLEVTKLSAIIYLIITMIPVLISVVFIKIFILKLVVTMSWILLSLRLIRPYMYKYEIEKK